MRFVTLALTTSLLVPLSTTTFAAQSPQSSASVSVPRLINISGVYHPADGQPVARVEVVTVAIYTEESGGAALWQETQSVMLDASGRYSLLLGATQGDGVPLDVFASGEARWLGMTWARPGEVEGPRMRLATVPYAIRASDADTLGGKPASAYLLAPAGTAQSTADASAPTSSTTAATPEPSAVLPGAVNTLAKYVGADDLGPSLLVWDTGSRIGINTSAPADLLHVAFTNLTGNLTGIAVQNLGNTAGSYSGMLFYDQNGALGQFQGFNNATHEYRINNIARNPSTLAFDGSINFMIGSTSRFLVNSNGNIGINTTTPLARLHVAGDVIVDGNIGAKYQDVAEWVQSSEPLEPGTVVVIDASSKDGVRAATAAYDPSVAGAVSAQPGLLLGESGPGKVLVAQSGRVRVKADARYGVIRAGDLLVTSPRKGYAMRSKPVRIGGTRLHRPGTILGKALEPLEKGTGEILVLLTLQ